MASHPLNLDTSPEIERVQIEGWRQMSPEQKAAMVSGLTQTAFDLALAGVRQRHPDASAREQLLRLAVITLGRDLACKACSDVALLDLSPEDILLQKLRWYRMGREVSDRQWRDILSIVRVQGPRLDREYLRQNAPVLGVTDLLARALNESAN